MNTLLEPVPIFAPQVSLSPLRAAGLPLMNTLLEPSATLTMGECFSHTAVLSMANAAGRPLMNTLGEPDSICPAAELKAAPILSPRLAMALPARPTARPSKIPPSPQVATVNDTYATAAMPTIAPSTKPVMALV
ncbi:hypothetical protein PSTA9_03781 [Pseudomonas syringae pv. tomato]|nr:hypothetical protein PSTA9_03781 [Pseudomonas syringae pv. tomato]